MTLEVLRSAVWALLIGGQLALAARLFFLRIHQPYAIFAAYLICSVVRSLFLIRMDPYSSSYSIIWASTDVLILILQVAMVFEVYNLTTSKYPVLAGMGRWALAVLAILAVSAALFSLRADLPIVDIRKLVPRATLIRRYVYTVLALFLIGTMAVFSVKVSERQNVAWHRKLMTVLFAGQSAAAYLLLIRSSSVIQAVNLFHLGFSAACIWTWVALMNRAGERVDLVPIEMPAAEMERRAAALMGLASTKFR